jgi:arginase
MPFNVGSATIEFAEKMNKNLISILNLKIDNLQPGTVAVVGIPFDMNSSFRRGAASAPMRVREGIFSESANMWTENGIDLGANTDWQIAGDLHIPDSQTAFIEIEEALERILQKEARPISLGGDHSITYPIMRAFAKKYKQLTILQLDAHPDLYDELNGNRHSHACPFARIMEENLAKRLVQVGIRTITSHQRQQVERFGVEVIEMKDLHKADDLHLEGDVYLSLDIDCLDPAFAPGVSHYEPGGMSTRDVLGIIQNMGGNLVGADIVEFNPERDPQGITAMVAAKLLKEIIARMLAEG